jgi:hypothetical protein
MLGLPVERQELELSLRKSGFAEEWGIPDT